MADGGATTIEALYIELGLDISQLEADLVAADQTIQQNLNRLRNESTLVRLRADVEIGGLDEAADAARILEVREEALNRQLEIQRDRIRITAAALQDLTNRRGTDAAETQRMAIRLERERLSLQRLQREIDKLHEADEAPHELADSYDEAGRRIQGTLEGINSNAENFTSGLNGAIETSLDLIEQIPTSYGKAIAAVAAMTAAMPVMEFAIVAASRTAVDRFNEIEEKAYELHMTFRDTYDYFNLLELAHAESDDIMGVIRGLDDAIAKGDVDDPEPMALARHGVSLQDEYGRFLDYHEQLKNLYEGYKRAKEAGEEVEYLLFLNGESIHEILPLFERWEEAERDSAKVAWADYNVAEMHEATRELKLLDNQIAEFGYSISSAVTPSARAAIQDLFEMFHTATQWVNDNKDSIARWGFILKESVAAAIAPLSAMKEKISEVNESSSGFVSDFVSKLAKSELRAFLTMTAPYTIFSDIFGKAEEDLKAANDAAANLTDKTSELNRQFDSSPLSYALRDSLQRASDLRDELKALRRDIDFDEDEYGKSIAEVDDWIEKELKGLSKLTADFDKAYEEAAKSGNEGLLKLLSGKMTIVEEEKTALYELAAAKIEKIEQDKEHALDDIRDAAAANFQSDLRNKIASLEKSHDDWINIGMDEAEAEKLTEQLKLDAIETLEEEFSAQMDSLHQSDFEKQLARIEKEKQAWIDKGVTEEAATALAEASKAKVIEDFNKNVTTNLGTIWQTELEKRLAQIEREKQAWIDKGVEEVKATKWAEQAKADAQRNAAMSVLRSQLEEYRAFREGGYEGLLNYHFDELFRAGIRPEDLEITPQLLADFQKAEDIAQRNLLSNFRSEYDRAEDDRLWKNGLVEQSRRRLGEMQKIWDGIEYPGKPDEITPELRASFGVLPDEVLEEMYNPISSVAAEFAELSPQVEGATEQLGNFEGAITEFSKVEPPELPEIESPEIPPTELEITAPPIDTGELDDSLKELSNAFEELMSPMDEFGGQLVELTDKLIDTTSALENLGVLPDNFDLSGRDAVERFAAQGYERNFAPVDFDIPVMTIPPIDTAAIDSAFENLVAPMNEVNARFAEMSTQLASITNGLADFSQSLNQFSEIRSQNNSSKPAAAVPPNITVTVQISEAHAWDSQHIQQLADKVADAIEPELVRAIGGDSNRY